MCHMVVFYFSCTELLLYTSCTACMHVTIEMNDISECLEIDKPGLILAAGHHCRHPCWSPLLGWILKCT